MVEGSVRTRGVGRAIEGRAQALLRSALVTGSKKATAELLVYACSGRSRVCLPIESDISRQQLETEAFRLSVVIWWPVLRNSGCRKRCDG
jgi:hypothetical protein